jgi:hypothetical protein
LGFDLHGRSRGAATTRLGVSGFDFAVTAQGATATRVGVSACPVVTTDEKFAITIRLGTVVAENGSGSKIVVVVLRPESKGASFSDTEGGADLGALATIDTLISSATTATSSSFSESSFFAEVLKGSAAGT